MTLVNDLRYALRQLRKAPGFTLTAVLTLALAIGANAVVFGILNGLILRTLNVPQPESLYGTEYSGGADAGWQSYPNYLDLRERNHSFEDLAAFGFAFVGLDTGNNPVSATGFAVTGNYFDVLKVQPYLGRFFHASDEHGAGSMPYIVLTYAYWHSQFQDDRSIIGRQIRLNKHLYTILGVAPPGFQGTLLFVSPQFFVPIVNMEQLSPDFNLTDRANDQGLFEVFGHLSPGVTPAQASADMSSVAAYLEKTYPKDVVHMTSSLSRQTGLASFGSATRAFVAALMLLAGLILLAACANLGSLFAAHAADHSRDVALRLALGSSRRRILRQFLTEAVLISLAGGAAGLAASVVLLRRISLWQPFPGVPVHLPLTPDARAYLVALALALASALLFGIVPVRQVLRANPYEIVKVGPSARLGKRVTVRDILLVVQIAICAVLVAASMVAVRGLERSLHGNFGFEPQNALMAAVNLATAGYPLDQVTAAEKRMDEALIAIPGVESVGWVQYFPPLVYASASKEDVFNYDTASLNNHNIAAMPYRYAVSPGYFRAAGTSLLAGRSFNWSDDKSAPSVAVVNREFAVRMFGSVPNAIGRYYKHQDGSLVRVVGVVEQGKYLSITEGNEPAVFDSALQYSAFRAYLVVRSHRSSQELASAMRITLRKVDAALPVDIETWNSLLAVALFPSRVATMALGVLGIMGAMLSITGIFGMAAYSVSKRMREFGIRMALGAKRTEVLQSALGRVAKLLALGTAAGLLLGLLATRVLAFIVYQATPRDPLVLAGAVAAMALLGLVATWIPAQRALAVNPTILLREE